MIYYGGSVQTSLHANEIAGRYSQYKKIELEILRTSFLDAGYSTIRLNSTYLETAEREFDEKGTDMFTVLIVTLIMIIGAIFLLIR